jgi:hypothetical protein
MCIGARSGRLGLLGAAARLVATWPFALVGLGATSHTCDTLYAIAPARLLCVALLRFPLIGGTRIMKCQYHFRIKGILKLGSVFPITFRDFVFTFHQNAHGLLDEIWVAVQVADRAEWPSFLPTPSGPIKGNLRITHPSYDSIVDIMRFLEGALSFFGMESIDVEDPSIEWLPEDPEEDRALSLHSFTSSRAEIDPNTLPETRLGLLAQVLYSHEDAWSLEPQLNFFRRGFVAIRDERFIEAIWNFYFYLESTFGNGQTKNKAVKRQFQSNQRIVQAVAAARDKFDLSKHPRRQAIYIRFDQAYRGKTEHQIIETIVDLRGYLHHHTAKRKGEWHPADKWQFAADAFILQSITHQLAYADLSIHVFSDKNKERFLTVAHEYTGI